MDQLGIRAPARSAPANFIDHPHCRRAWALARPFQRRSPARYPPSWVIPWPMIRFRRSLISSIRNITARLRGSITPSLPTRKPIFFIRGQPFQPLHTAQPFTIVIGNTGISSPTGAVVGDVRQRWQADPSPYEHLFDEIGAVASRRAGGNRKWAGGGTWPADDPQPYPAPGAGCLFA